jgi:hypothetical protein
MGMGMGTGLDLPAPPRPCDTARPDDIVDFERHEGCDATEQLSNMNEDDDQVKSSKGESQIVKRFVLRKWIEVD